MNVTDKNPKIMRAFEGAYYNMCLSQISYLGDINGNGYGAIGIGMGFCNEVSSRYANNIYSIIHGGPKTNSFPSKFDYTYLNGENGFSLISKNSSYLGIASCPLGNFLGNGTNGLIVSSPGSNVKNFPNSGQVYIIRSLGNCEVNNSSEEKYEENNSYLSLIATSLGTLLLTSMLCCFLDLCLNKGRGFPCSLIKKKEPQTHELLEINPAT